MAKIKKKRDNNEKIGQLLKTYGVAQLSDLPAEKDVYKRQALVSAAYSVGGSNSKVVQQRLLSSVSRLQIFFRSKLFCLFFCIKEESFHFLNEISLIFFGQLAASKKEMCIRDRRSPV